jgi:hypothetical protein
MCAFALPANTRQPLQACTVAVAQELLLAIRHVTCCAVMLTLLLPVNTSLLLVLSQAAAPVQFAVESVWSRGRIIPWNSGDCQHRTAAGKRNQVLAHVHMHTDKFNVCRDGAGAALQRHAPALSFAF